MFGSTNLNPITMALGMDTPDMSWLYYQGNGDPISRIPSSQQQQQQQEADNGMFSTTTTRMKQERDLGSNDNDSYLVDEDGESYEPYSLAWRYLGVYLDCNEDDDDNDDEVDSQEERRLSKDNSGDSDCSRKVLWAAVSCLCPSVTHVSAFPQLYHI